MTSPRFAASTATPHEPRAIAAAALSVLLSLIAPVATASTFIKLEIAPQLVDRVRLHFHSVSFVGDLGLPDGDGAEVMRRMSKSGAVRGIALSGYAAEKDIRECREAGFHVHLSKPVDFSELLAAVENLEPA